jgi:hypothetical protein
VDRTRYTQHLRHKTLLKTHAKTELHILDQMELDELIAFADRHSVDIREEVKVDKAAVLNMIMNDPLIIELRKEHNLC